VLLFFRRSRRAGLGLAAGAVLVALLNVGLLTAGVIAPTRHTGPNLLMAIQSTSSEGIVFSTRGFSAEERAAPLATYVRFAAEHPGTFAHQRASALWELWGPWPAAGDASSPRGAGTRVLIGLRFVLVLLAIGGLVRRYREPDAWLLAAPILAITVVHVVFFATPRFTYVVEPLALVLAAWAIRDTMARRRIGPSAASSLAT
jgi:hypothetical protein